MADAWVGGFGDRERTLRIMKDPACGPIAVTVIVLTLLIKYAAIEQIVGEDYWPALLIVPILGRTALVVALLTLPYIRKEGLGSHAAQQLPKPGGWLAVALATLFTAIMLGSYLLPLFAVLTALFLLFKGNVMRRIGGITGDIVGALCEIVEVTALLVIALQID
jgi:adenosylcobinamide-GDP ribazoletransferase